MNMSLHNGMDSINIERYYVFRFWGGGGKSLVMFRLIVAQ